MRVLLAWLALAVSVCGAVEEMLVRDEKGVLVATVVPSLAVAQHRGLDGCSLLNVTRGRGWVACSVAKGKGALLRLHGTWDGLAGCETERTAGAAELVAAWGESEAASSASPRVRLQSAADKREKEKRAGEEGSDQRSFVSRYWWVFATVPLLLVALR